MSISIYSRSDMGVKKGVEILEPLGRVSFELPPLACSRRPIARTVWHAGAQPARDSRGSLELI